jgi:D-3-phosphoglycerate dehydrogenase
MKVLIAGAFEQSGQDGLIALGLETIYRPELTGPSLTDALAALAPDVLIVRGTRVTADMMTPGLKLIVRAGAGINTIDVEAATAKGILVANCPGKNAIAVAELTMALLLAVDRRIPENVAALRAGVWNKKGFSEAPGVFGRTLGVLGAGPIAVEVIRRAASFGMRVVVWSRRFDGQDREMPDEVVRQLGLDVARGQTTITLAPSARAVAERCDVLSVHLALNADTRGCVGAEVLGALRPGACFINTARGEVVDAEALRRAIDEQQLRVALDVFAIEPATSTGVFADPVVHQPGVYGTHHIGASTTQAQEAVAAETVRIVKSFITTGQAPNTVNG